MLLPKNQLCKNIDKLQLTRQNLGRVLNFRSGHVHVATFLVLSAKLPNLPLKTWLKQLVGSLPLVIVLPGKNYEDCMHPWRHLLYAPKLIPPLWAACKVLLSGMQILVNY
jgi:hypothetical protein